MLPSRRLLSLPLSFLAHQLRFIRRPRIVPPLRLLPILSTDFLASALSIRELLFLRRKFCPHRALFIPLIQRPQSRTPLIRCYLYPLNQWLTIQRQPGLHFAVRNQLSSLANHYVLPSNRSMRIKLCPLKRCSNLRPRHGNLSSEIGFIRDLRCCPLTISLRPMKLPKRIDSIISIKLC